MKKTMLPPSFFVCARCGVVITAAGGRDPRCRTGARHTLLREVDPAQLRFPELGPPHPFLKFRGLLHAYHLARREGATDSECVDEIESIARAVALPERTAMTRTAALEEALGLDPRGALWIAIENAESFRRRRAFDLAIGRAFLLRWVALASPAQDDPDLDEEGGFALEGSATLGWELAAEAHREATELDRVFLCAQDGGLACGVVQGLREAFRLGGMRTLPRFQMVELRDAPIEAIWNRLIHRILPRVHADLGSRRIWEAAERYPRVREQIADSLRAGLRRGAADPVRIAVEEELRREASERPSGGSGEPREWYVLVRGMLESGGFPIVPSEDHLALAGQLVQEAGRTSTSRLGSAALAGMIRLRAAGDLRLDERTLVVLS